MKTWLGLGMMHLDLLPGSREEITRLQSSRLRRRGLWAMVSLEGVCGRDVKVKITFYTSE